MRPRTVTHGSRSAACALALLLIGHSGAPGPAYAQTPAPLRVIATHLEGSAGVEYARVLGTFAKYGVSVQVQQANSGEAAAAAVAGGAADIAIGTVLALMAAHQHGIPLTFIAPAVVHVQGEPTNALVVAATSVIHSAADLNGKVIGTQAISDMNTIATKAWLEKSGADVNSVKFIELPTPQMAAAVQKRTIDAAVIGSPALSAALASQCCRTVTFPYDAIAKRFLLNGWYARTDWIASHRDEAQRFARAIVEAERWSNEDRVDSAKILGAYSNIDPALLASMPRETFAERFDPQLFEPLMDLAVRYKLLNAPFPPSELYRIL